MDALELLQTRTSTEAGQLVDPAPSDSEITTILRAAVAAPDHGGLQPWAFVIIRGESRVRLGDVFAEAARARDPMLDTDGLEKQRAKPLRAPLIIAVAARIDPDHPKIPVIEQILSAGAAAQQIQLAANALGYGSVWLTGANAHDPAVSEALGLDFDDRIVGFIHIGTPKTPTTARKRPDPAQFVREWHQAHQLETL